MLTRPSLSCSTWENGGTFGPVFPRYFLCSYLPSSRQVYRPLPLRSMQLGVLLISAVAWTTATFHLDCIPLLQAHQEKKQIDSMAPDFESCLSPFLPLPLFHLRTTSLQLPPFLFLIALRPRVQWKVDKLKGQYLYLWETGFVDGGFDYFLFAVSRRHDASRGDCDGLTENTASSNAGGTVKKYTQVQLVLPSRERNSPCSISTAHLRSTVELVCPYSYLQSNCNSGSIRFSPKKQLNKV